MNPASLRTRILAGALLWTVGLFIGAVLLWGVLLLRHKHYPILLHSEAMKHGDLFWIAVLVCMVGGFWVVRRALAPLNRLRERLTSVRQGRAQQVAGKYPAEVQPLVDDLNALLEHRDQAVRRAIAKAGDLAHGLKTPLALLAQEADRARANGHHELAATLDEQIDRMRRQVDYHLAHARASASGTTAGATCSVLESVDGLTRTLRRLHVARGIVLQVGVSPDHLVRVQREDLDEMLGNLMDNACKWTRNRVDVQSVQRDGFVTITVDDDGPGLPTSMRDVVLQRGVRADQASPGSGFGLAIVRDLSELYGGAIALDGSPGGGLRAELRLPAAKSG